MSEKLIVRCCSRIHNLSSNYRAGEEGCDYIITDNIQNFVLELKVWMMMWQPVLLPLSLSPPLSRSSSGVREFDAMTHHCWRWFFKQLEWHPSFFFFSFCINKSNLSCSGAQMQVWIWRRATDCAVWLVLSWATFMNFYHYFHNRKNRLIERQNYWWGKMCWAFTATLQKYSCREIFSANKVNEKIDWL